MLSSAFWVVASLGFLRVSLTALIKSALLESSVREISDSVEVERGPTISGVVKVEGVTTSSSEVELALTSTVTVAVDPSGVTFSLDTV